MCKNLNIYIFIPKIFSIHSNPYPGAPQYFRWICLENISIKSHNNLKHLNLENISVFSCDGKHYHKITIIFLRENISINFSMENIFINFPYYNFIPLVTALLLLFIICPVNILHMWQSDCGDFCIETDCPRVWLIQS